jgi:hypothetical protein
LCRIFRRVLVTQLGIGQGHHGIVIPFVEDAEAVQPAVLGRLDQIRIRRFYGLDFHVQNLSTRTGTPTSA